MPASVFKSARNKTAYFNAQGGREMYPPGNNGNGLGGLNGDTSGMSQRQPATARTQQQWLEANAQARLAAQPRSGPYSQLDQPVVSSLDPHKMTQNPLDPFQDNIYYLLSVYRNRNANIDPRGQPAHPPDIFSGQDQLVQVRNTARLMQHGSYVQITGCAPPRAPVY